MQGVVSKTRSLFQSTVIICLLTFSLAFTPQLADARDPWIDLTDAKAAQKQGNHSDVIRKTTAVIASRYFDGKELAKVYVMRAQAHERMGDLASAIVDYSKAISIQPNGFKSFVNRGMIFLRLKRSDEALKDFNAAIANNPKHPFAYVNRAIIWKQRVKLQSALNDLNKALDMAPGMLVAIAARGEIYWMLKRDAEAVADYSVVLKLPNANPIFHWWRGMSLNRLRKFDAALSDLNHVVKARLGAALTY
ncbi:MAG: tetratricopeptide repeat protein [Rhodospirillaceae bacterium]|jgi:tetratricopeptide (TPR) repeat protein|nr:tetratricopeptide repeat protein [Rhodospirillaceae bacterium]